MFHILLVIEFIVSFCLIIVVLLQASKGGGLAGVMGQSQTGAFFGVRRTADFLSKATTYLAIIFISLCIVMNLFFLPSKKNTPSQTQGQTQTK